MARVTIRRGPPAVAMTAAWVIAAAVFGAQLAASDTTMGHAISLALFLLSLAGAYRAYRSNTIVATDQGLVVRRFARTFRWPWSEIHEVGAVEHINGFRGKGKLIEIRTDQRDLRLREFFWVASEGGPSKPESLVDELNSARPIEQRDVE